MKRGRPRKKVHEVFEERFEDGTYAPEYVARPRRSLLSPSYEEVRVARGERDGGGTVLLQMALGLLLGLGASKILRVIEEEKAKKALPAHASLPERAAPAPSAHAPMPAMAWSAEDALRKAWATTMPGKPFPLAASITTSTKEPSAMWNELHPPFLLMQNARYFARLGLSGFEKLASEGQVAAKFAENGFQNVKVYKGGLPADAPFAARGLEGPFAEGQWGQSNTETPLPSQVKQVWVHL